MTARARYSRLEPTKLCERIAGIPCIVAVTRFVNVPDSRWEQGYSEVDYTICDKRGYPAPWLERKLTPKERGALEERLVNTLAESYSL